MKVEKIVEPIEAPVIIPTESEVSKDTVVAIINNIDGKSKNAGQ